MHVGLRDGVVCVCVSVCVCVGGGGGGGSMRVSEPVYVRACVRLFVCGAPV